VESAGDGEPGVAEQGGVDGVDGVYAVVAGAGEVGADTAVVGECGGGVPVPGDGLMSLGVFEGLLRPESASKHRDTAWR
jgi:hypothetical protein